MPPQQPAPSTQPHPQAPPLRRIAIFGTGLIGASIGLALRQAGFTGSILGWDPQPATLQQARALGAIDPAVAGEADEDPFVCALAANLIILAGPVFTIAQWLQQLAPVLSPAQLVTDVGSVKGFLVEQAGTLYNGPGQPGWLPGHPMAGKEHSGAAHAEANLFTGATWLLTGSSADSANLPTHPHAAQWLGFIQCFGAHSVALTPTRHDLLCASISHLPQMLATALAAMLQETLKNTLPEISPDTLQDQFDPELALSSDLQGIGGRALREMTRLAASPYSMWRDIAIANQPALTDALLRMEQQLAYLRENLKGPELRHIFDQANTFRATLLAAAKP